MFSIKICYKIYQENGNYASLAFESRTGYHIKGFLGQEQGQAFGVPVAHPTLKFGEYPPRVLKDLTVLSLILIYSPVS